VPERALALCTPSDQPSHFPQHETTAGEARLLMTNLKVLASTSVWWRSRGGSQGAEALVPLVVLLHPLRQQETATIEDDELTPEVMIGDIWSPNTRDWPLRFGMDPTLRRRCPCRGVQGPDSCLHGLRRHPISFRRKLIILDGRRFPAVPQRMQKHYERTRVPLTPCGTPPARSPPHACRSQHLQVRHKPAALRRAVVSVAGSARLVPTAYQSASARLRNGPVPTARRTKSVAGTTPFFGARSLVQGEDQRRVEGRLRATLCSLRHPGHDVTGYGHSPPIRARKRLLQERLSLGDNIDNRRRQCLERDSTAPCQRRSGESRAVSLLPVGQRVLTAGIAF